MADQPTCPVCGKEVIEFAFATGTQWYHLIDGMPQPSSPACAPPVRWQDSVTMTQIEEMALAADKLNVQPGQTVTAKYQLINGVRVMVPGSMRVSE